MAAIESLLGQTPASPLQQSQQSVANVKSQDVAPPYYIPTVQPQAGQMQFQAGFGDQTPVGFPMLWFPSPQVAYQAASPQAAYNVACPALVMCSPYHQLGYQGGMIFTTQNPPGVIICQQPSASAGAVTPHPGVALEYAVSKSNHQLQLHMTHQMASSISPYTADSQPYEKLPSHYSTNLNSAGAVNELIQQMKLSSNDLLETSAPNENRPLPARPPPGPLGVLQSSQLKRYKRGSKNAAMHKDGMIQSLTYLSTTAISTVPTIS
jgi:hypothetical protein